MAGCETTVLFKNYFFTLSEMKGTSGSMLAWNERDGQVSTGTERQAHLKQLAEVATKACASNTGMRCYLETMANMNPDNFTVEGLIEYAQDALKHAAECERDALKKIQDE